MTYIKFCRAIHNIFEGWPTVQVSTLDYYRELEGKSPIGDAGEGRHELSFEQGMTAIITDDLSERTFGGAVRGEGGPLQMIANLPGAKFRVDVSNCYVFCVSSWPDGSQLSLSDAGAVSPGYDSMYEIADPAKFQRLLTNAIADNLTLGHLTPESLAAVRTLPSDERYLLVRGERRAVEYVESRATPIRSAADLENGEPYQQALLRALYTKEQRHSGDREFRFTFIVTNSRHQMLSVRLQPMLVNSDQVAAACDRIAPLNHPR